MKLLISLSLLVASSLCSQGAIASPKGSTPEPTAQSVHFFKKQVRRSSFNNALKGLINRYPHKTAEFVSIALTAYPKNYKEIITTSVSTQPTYVDEIIILANEYKVASPTEIVKLAISAEPSYASLATSAACEYSPEEFSEIVKAAVNIEPDSADQIAQKLVSAYPSKTMEILITTIKEVPLVGKYVLDALLATVNDDEIKSESMIIISVEQLAQYPDAIERLVDIAHQRDIDAEKVRVSAMKGGLSDETITALINAHYITEEVIESEQ